ncbi:O-antigen polysaccharide polymerase Wzy [Mangrovimonas sp. CR14]|uniref:O-antigen polysaccharide polymerase Wzy n=1 Tax=Mangrovimonas sp. CR14 TaxID=2706120 RepID=UPI00141FD8C2|nr:O-antigen polysaccharide polymerase Wzy [Mangrovimonas sp. CR14]NIK91355.1 O-antigen polysaccharide polymerase Wzy [Mangrovimonas sp. CR14]
MWSVLGVVFVLFISWRFIDALGKSLPILELMMLIAGLQWVVGPFISYGQETTHYKYFMYVDQETYMSYIVPAFLCFCIPLLIILKNQKASQEINFLKYLPFAKALLFIGIGADVLSRFTPQSLAFFFFLVEQFKFIGALLLLFSAKKLDQYYFYGAIFYLLINALSRAMFHDLLLWGVFMFMYWCIKNKPALRTRLALIFAGIVFAIMIQSVKAAFRSQVWGGFQGNKVELFVNLLDEKVSSGYFEEETTNEQLNVRMNQGWIISAIMYYTPTFQSFAAGETVKEAVFSSILPRFLNPNKKLAGGQENFEKYTGLPLGDGTSMGMSIIGESYANFGVFNGIIFMSFWGGFLAWYWKKILSFAYDYPLILMFLPIIFLQVVKAETELVVVLNHLFKASIVVTLFFWVARKYLNWPLKETV